MSIKSFLYTLAKVFPYYSFRVLIFEIKFTIDIYENLKNVRRAEINAHIHRNRPYNYFLNTINKI